MTTLNALFSIPGFIPDAKRDSNYEKKLGESVSQVQGSLAFCQAWIQWTEANPGNWPDLKQVLTLTPGNPDALILIAKIVGHILHLKGTIPVAKNQTCQFEGFSETFCIPKLIGRWNAFAREGFVSQETHAVIAFSLLNALWHDNCSEQRLKEVLTDIHNPSYSCPTVVGTGWVWHSTYAIFYKHPEDSKNEIRIAYCNRGSDCGDRSGIVFLKVKDKSKITLEFLEVLGNRIKTAHAHYMSLERIKNELGAEEVIHFPMTLQKSGNCSYANLKATIYALLRILKELDMLSPEEVLLRKNYKQFVAYDANETLIELAQNFLSNEMLLAPLKYYERLALIFCDFAFEKTIKPKKVDLAVLRKIIQSIEASGLLKEPIHAIKTFTVSQHALQSIKRKDPLLPLTIQSYSLHPIDYSVLKKLNLVSGNLTKFPSQIESLTNLTKLSLRHNRIEEIPPAISCLINLKRLNFNNNWLSKISEKITSLTNLTQLNLSDNPIGTVPQVIENLINLEDLDLSSIGIHTLSGAIAQLTNLKRLVLLGNCVLSLPPGIGLLTRLKTLFFKSGRHYYEQFEKEFPKTVRHLTNLEHLSLENCVKNEVLASTIEHLTNLQSLSLEGNEIDSLPSTLFESCIHLKTLSLSKNFRLSLIPPKVSSLYQLETLVLSSTEISILPDTFRHLVTLKNLSLDWNKFAVFPPAINSLTNLQSLNLAGNRIASIPFEFFLSCTNLTNLSLEKNKLISSIPPEIGLLTRLETLLLRENEISEVPNTFSCLVSLKELVLSYNRVKTLPNSFWSLTNLKTVCLDNNKITTPITGLNAFPPKLKSFEYGWGS
jgi:Leucine-rich repeat (LRR) protein